MEPEERVDYPGLCQAAIRFRYQGCSPEGDRLARSLLRLSGCVSPQYDTTLVHISADASAALIVGKRNEADIAVDASGEMYSHVFGSTATPFERFVVDRKIMGPCWLNIKGPNVNKGDAVRRVEWYILPTCLD